LTRRANHRHIESIARFKARAGKPVAGIFLIVLRTEFHSTHRRAPQVARRAAAKKTLAPSGKSPAYLHHREN
jgi:hypothetical protein